MRIDSIDELQKLFSEYSCGELPRESYNKSRYVHFSVYRSLVKYELNFEPYLQIARKCSMTDFAIKRSLTTNRFYIGFINHGGHAATCIVRPVTLVQLMDYQYLEKMFSNYGQELERAIDHGGHYDI